MKLASSLALLSSFVSVVFGEDAAATFAVDHQSTAAIEDGAIAAVADQNHRDLQCDTVAAWHPDYSAGWSLGKCDLTTTCNSQSYSTNLACCQGAFAGQESKYCVSKLATPPTTSPTKTGGPDVYYPDYSLPWPDGKCINTTPVPSGRPTYSTQIACCKGAYGGQTSGACIKGLAKPPTQSPTVVGAVASLWYPDYTLAWPDGKCISTLPAPSGRPTYSTQIACCKGAYGGQTSNTCIKSLATPPTQSPTVVGATASLWYPDYTLAWPDGKCISTLPAPSGRPTYSSNLACCKGAYGGQTSKTCVKSLATPPTSSPTKVSPDVWYPNYALAWTEGKCINQLPVPSGWPTYSTELACCKAAYGGQMSTACIRGMVNPPTKSPTRSPTSSPTRSPTSKPT